MYGGGVIVSVVLYRLVYHLLLCLWASIFLEVLFCMQ